MTDSSHIPKGIIIAAPASGSGKTTITLGLLRALKDRGIPVAGAKCGPDYIDPKFHEAACARPCFNLDAFAMSPARLRELMSGQTNVLIEGVMGLFDGAANGKGSTADLARVTGFPIVLVVDCARMAQSIGAMVHGYSTFDPSLHFAGVILNNVGSDRHESILRAGLKAQPLPVLGVVRRGKQFTHPARHLGLVQAQERHDLDAFIQSVGDHIGQSVDLDGLVSAMKPTTQEQAAARTISPPAQRIGIAADAAYSFAYPHILSDWRKAGAEISFFSPLNDEGPKTADFIMLPGGYPELYAATLAANMNFKSAMKQAAEQGALIYGECGGYMTLGTTLTDANGNPHEMLGLLDLHTSFAKRKLHLGYRRLSATSPQLRGDWLGHEFHYATTISAKGAPLFHARDGWDRDLGEMGLVNGNVFGSFAHIIDRAS